MAVALAWPEPEKRGRGNKKSSKNEDFNIASGYISQARFVLRHCLDKAEEVLRNAHYPLTKAYEEVQAMVEQQRKDEEERQERLRQLAALRVASFPQRRARIEGLLPCGYRLGVPPRVRNLHRERPDYCSVESLNRRKGAV